MTIDVSGQPVRRPSDTDKFGVAWQPGMNRQGGTLGPMTGSSGPVTVTVSGPWFEHRELFGEMVEAMQYRVAAAALERVQFNLDRSIRYPTPYYETQIMMQAAVSDLVVHDRGIAYGNWLEGVSSRNQATSFKGYHSFRRAADEVERQAPQICEQVANHYVAKLQ